MPNKRNYPTNKVINNHIDEAWTFDFLEMSDYILSNYKQHRYILVAIDSFSNFG